MRDKTLQLQIKKFFRKGNVSLPTKRVEESYPKGTIYTIYSLNLRYLFQLDSEKALGEEINVFRSKIEIITWIKAKQRQEFDGSGDAAAAKSEGEFEEKFKEILKEAGVSQDINFLSTEAANVKILIEMLRDIKNQRALKKNEIATQKNLKEYEIEMILDSVISLVTKKLLDSNEPNDELMEIVRAEIDSSENKLERAKWILKEAINYKGDAVNSFAGDGNTGKLFSPAINKLSKILNSIKKQPSTKGVNALLSTLAGSRLNKTNLEKSLNKLDKIHEDLEGLKIEKIRERRKEIRNAEKFLASDEFAKFAADPYFLISKDKKREIEVNCVKDNELVNATSEEKELIEMGHEFAVFRGNLKDNWLNSTTYKIKTKENIIYYLRLSKLGLLQIRKEEILSGDKKLIDVLAELLESQGRKEVQADDILQVAVGFAKLLNFQTASNFKTLFANERKIIPLSLEEAKNKYSEIERQRYALILFNKLSDKSGANISPSYVHQNNPEVIPCILQGTLEVIGNGKVNSESSKYHIHKIPEREEQKINDLSTWKNELCVFSPERGFIFFNHKKTLEDGGRLIDYEDYWKCLVRGVEYTVALRASLQVLESKTTRLLDSIPEILQQFNEESNGGENREELLKTFAEDLANILKILPPLRSIAIPTNAFRSGHSVDKFAYLSEDCFRFSETLSNIQQNIDELTNFLTFFKQQQLVIKIDDDNKEDSKQNNKLNIIALLFTITSILYVFPSFVKDFSDWKFIEGGLNFTWFPNSEFALTVIYLLFLIVILLSCYWLYMYPESRYSKFLKSPFQKKKEMKPIKGKKYKS